MKLSPLVLAEIIDAVREGITEGRDISDRLRAIDLFANQESGMIELSPEWLRSNRRILND